MSSDYKIRQYEKEAWEEPGQPLKRLTRQELEKLIEEKGGPEGLRLSDYDFSDVNLSGMNLNGVIFGTDWRTPNRNTACLKGALLTKCQLRGADFTHVDLTGVRFFRSDLRNAIMGVTNCTDTDFRRADLRGVNFYGARLNNTDFSEADLRNSDFHAAYINGVDLINSQIGRQLLFEDYAEYSSFLKRHKVEEHTVKIVLSTRHLLAKQTYLVLKNAFLSKGQYDEASWAYFKERIMEKKTHFPLRRARYCYANELENLSQSGLKHAWINLKFSVRHLFLYLVDWAAQLSCGFGERPLRALWWALVTIFTFPILYRFSGGVVGTNEVKMSWIDYINYSFGAFTTIGFSNFQTTTALAQTLTSIEALLGISILALLMFTLGNRISRS